MIDLIGSGSPWWLLFLLLTTGTPSTQSDRIRQSEALLERGEYQAAEQLLRPLVSHNSDPRGAYLLGFTLIGLHRYDEAEAHLRRAVEQRPREHQWLYALGKCLLEQGRSREAMRQLDRALALADNPDYRFAKAMCALNAGELEVAEAELRDCLRQRPSHSEALFKLGRLLVDRGDYAGAMPYLRASLGASPRHLEARFFMGLAELRAGDLNAAVELLQGVVDEVPGHAGALYNLGRALRQQGRDQQALAVLQEFKTVSVTDDEIDYVTRAVQKNPGNLDGRLHLAELLLESGRIEEALEQLRAGRQLNAGRPRLYRLMGRAIAMTGRADEAQRLYEYAERLENPRP